MSFILTKEQEQVQKMMRSFVENEVAPIADEMDKAGEFPVDLVKKMGRYGLMGVAFPKEYGGAGADYVSYAIVIEELSKAWAAAATIVAAHNSLCCWPIFGWGNEEQKQKYLPDLLSGKKLGAFGLTEPNAGSDAGAQQTRVDVKDDCYVLNGAKVFITNGAYADVFVVMAMNDKKKGTRGGISAFIVEKGDPGFSIGKSEEKLGIHSSSTTELVFQDCTIPKDRLLGKIGDGFKVAMSTLEGGRIGVASQAVGIAQGAFDLAVEYMKQRKQFGKKLSQFQALQFEMADMDTRIHAARLLVREAAVRKDQHLPMGKNSAMAKYYAADTAMQVAVKCLQFHGGYGFTQDYAIERFFRDAKITEIYEGTSEVQKIIIAGTIFGKK
ncbi:acyl-CoA dehydrogenase [Bacilliculturomica massiliensis]|uniref:acyl-CoA dehydrogenase n=1 Tax=Bacilliculturomica massiliensis TaxID=1917867 RepID=UPI00102F5A58|nr:acyl-CoA dehydrogenase [Bacilliculturomica massiliensis]